MSALKPKQFVKDGTEYSGRPTLLTFSVIFRSTWLDKGWKNKMTIFVASSFLLSLSLWLMKTAKTVSPLPPYSQYSLGGEGTFQMLAQRTHTCIYTRYLSLWCNGSDSYFLWKLGHNHHLLILFLSFQKQEILIIRYHFSLYKKKEYIIYHTILRIHQSNDIYHFN